jgi:hypothetical protein
VNRLATALRVTLAELFAPMDRRFRSRARRTRRDKPRKKACSILSVNIERRG